MIFIKTYTNHKRKGENKLPKFGPKKNMGKIENVDFEIKWEGEPSGLWGSFLSLIHMNFTTYQITKDELSYRFIPIKRRKSVW